MVLHMPPHHTLRGGMVLQLFFHCLHTTLKLSPQTEEPLSA